MLKFKTNSSKALVSIITLFTMIMLVGMIGCSEEDNPVNGEGEDPGARGNPTFTITWSYDGDSQSEGPDIDIWVVDPREQTLSTSRDGYSLGPTPQGGRIDYDDQGATGPGDGGGPERVYWPLGEASHGTYTYGVRYYAGTGTAHYTLRVYKNGNLYTTKTGTLTCPDGSYPPLGSRVTVGTIQNP